MTKVISLQGYKVASKIELNKCNDILLFFFYVKPIVLLLCHLL